MEKTPVHYVDKAKFYESCKEWHKERKEALARGDEAPRIPEYCGKCIADIAYGLAQKHQFRKYSFLDSMISDAIENSVRYFHNFDPDKFDNPFAYFTQATKMSFVRTINEEEKKRYVVYKTYANHHIMEGGDHEKKGLTNEGIYDNIEEFIARFEEKERKKREKKQRKQKETKEEPKGLTAFMKDNE